MAMRLDVSERVDLTPAQMVMWEETLTAFSWETPSFTHLLYERLNPDRSRMVATWLGTSRVPAWFIAGVNGKRIFLVPERFFALDLKERIFILAHEVAHPMLGHIIAGNYYRQRKFIDVGFKHLPYNDMLAGYAMDLVINDMLIESRIGKFVKGGLHDPKFATYKDSWIDVYEKMLDEASGGDGPTEPCEGGEGGEGGEGNPGGSSDPKDQQQPERNGQKGFDVHMGFKEGEKQSGQPDQPEEGDQKGPPEGSGSPQDAIDADEGVSPEDMAKEAQATQQAIAAAIEVGRARGKLPAALQMFCEKLLEPVVDWPEHIKALFARRLGSGGYDFRRPDRRFLVRDIIVPGRSGKGARLVIGGGDSSGSIYAVPQLTDRFMAEFGGIVEDVKPHECRVIWCDAEVQRVDILEDMADVHKMVHKGSEGGGGTSFVPVFQYIEEHGLEPDALVYLTDGDGEFPAHPPRFPVIWADISGDPKKYPFGDVVHVPVPRKVLDR